MKPSRPAAEVQRWLQDIREQEAAQTIASLVGNLHSILNIGPSWGRDYYHLTGLGKSVINADVAPQSHLASLVLADVTDGLPFADTSFDAVLLPEVLEHLIDDALALAETRRVLRDDGLLVITVPFYNDEPDYHVRLHSPHTIRRLLNGTGFEIVAYLERGGLISFPKLVHAARQLCSIFIKPSHFNTWIIWIDHLIARQLRWLVRWTRVYGCYLAARKSATYNYRQLNIVEFRHLD